MATAYPWRNGGSVTEVVRHHRALLVNVGMVQTGLGYTDAELRQAEERIVRPMPPEVRELYLAAKPREVGESHWPSMGLFLPESDRDVAWYRLAVDRPHPLDLMFREAVPHGWEEVDGFMIGGTPYFDRLFVITGHSRYPDGSLLLTDHEADYEEMLVVVARSLAEYLERLCFFKGAELVAVPSNCHNFPSEHVRLLAKEIVELNPNAISWKYRGRGGAIARSCARILGMMRGRR